jgi:hypothetical protein
MKNAKQAFQDKLITMDIANITPSKDLSKTILISKKYQTILASVKTIGLVEPPVITFKDGKIRLLDGHIRLHILKSLGVERTDCLVSTDDESYTYNRHISQISNVQERNMILKAIENGASMEKIAEALGIDVRTLQDKKNLLEHIHPDVIEMFKTRKIPTKTFDFLRKMKDLRQIEVAQFMCNANNFSTPLAHHFWADTKPEMLRVQPLKRNPADIEKLASLENAIGKIHKEYKLIYSDFGKHVARLQVAQAWIRSIFGNALARKFLERHYPDILRRFNELVDLTDLNDLKDDNIAGNPAL